MKTPSVSLLLGASLLLLFALTVCAVVSFVPPFSPTRSFIQLMVVVPFLIATVRMYSVLSRMKPGLPESDAEELTQFIGADREVEEDVDDITANVIEHEF